MQRITMLNKHRVNIIDAVLGLNTQLDAVLESGSLRPFCSNVRA